MSTEYQRGRFSIHTDREKMDIDFVQDYLSCQSYWALGRSRQVVEKSIQNSLCFGVFDDEQQVGFARIGFAQYINRKLSDIHPKRAIGVDALTQRDFVCGCGVLLTGCDEILDQFSIAGQNQPLLSQYDRAPP